MPWRKDAPPCPTATARFVEVIQAHAVDLVQTNTIMLREPLIAARQVGVPGITHVHESPMHDADLCTGMDLPARQIVEEAMERADCILANSNFTARNFAKPGATHLVSNIINVSAFDLPNDVDSHCITAALISSNLPKKGLDDLIAIGHELAADTPNLQLLLIGPDTAFIDELRQAQARGEVPDNVKLMPYAPSPQAAISQANIVLNLSHCQETFGRTLLEGMAAQRPVLAYGWGALPELIRDGVNGFVLEPGDIKGMADRLRKLAQHPEQILAMGRAGRKLATEYDLKRMCRQLGGAYNAALGSVRK